jgi:CRP-like cAMP-binding protein
MNAPNGAAPDSAALDPLAHIRAELEDALAPLREREAKLQAELTEVVSQEQRIVNALVALGAQKPKASESPRRRLREAGANTGQNWMPSEEKIQKVYLALKRAGPEPVSTAQLSQVSGFSRETVNRAMRALREREQVRLVGVAGQGNAHMYALMPGADDGA